MTLKKLLSKYLEESAINNSGPFGFVKLLDKYIAPILNKMFK